MDCSFPQSLVGADEHTVVAWVASYIRMSGLEISVADLVHQALRVEGTHRGVTKTKCRKARRRWLANRRTGNN